MVALPVTLLVAGFQLKTHEQRNWLPATASCARWLPKRPIHAGVASASADPTPVVFVSTRLTRSMSLASPKSETLAQKPCGFCVPPDVRRMLPAPERQKD